MLSKLYYVSCDGCGRPCGEAVVYASDARTHARQAGWTRVKREAHGDGETQMGADYCKTCAAKKAGA